MDSAAETFPLAKGLHIHLGPRDASVIARLRQAVAPGFLLFHLHPGEPFDCQVPNCLCASLDSFPSALEKLSAAIEELGLDDGASVCSSSSCGLEKLFGERLAEARRRAAASLSSVRCARAGGMLFLRAAVQNIPSILANGPWSLSRSMSGFNAVICGAGPSLSASLPLLARLQGSCAIIAVGRACKTLLDAGIVPDLVCEMDSVAHVNWPSGLKAGVPLLAPLTLSPDVASRFDRILWTSAGGAPWLLPEALKLSLPHVSMDRSVGVYALDAALRLFQFDEAALLGFDLCFGPSGSSHAGQGATSDGDEASLCEVPGRDGGFVKANSLFNGMRESFESCAKSFPGRVFNCSAGGSAIAGAKPLDLEAFAVRRPPFAFKGAFDSCVKASPFDAQAAKVKLAELTARRLSGSSAVEQGLRSFVAKHALSLAKESPSAFDAPPFASSLLDELLGDLDLALGKAERMAEAHCLFERSLRPYVIKRLSQTHRELSDFLSAGEPPSSGRRWLLSPNFMSLPFAGLERPDGSFFRLSSRLSMEPAAGAEIEAFLKRSSFDPARDVAVFIAPGNWIHPVELAKRLPEARILIAEPWLELFSLLASRCQFLHKLPASAQVVGASDLVPGWRATWRRRVARLEADGFRLKAFEHPRTWLLPEIRSLAESLLEL